MTMKSNLIRFCLPRGYLLLMKIKLNLINTLFSGSLSSCYQSILANQMCHTETMECLLRLNTSMADGLNFDGETHGGYGFTLQNATLGSEMLLQPPIIGYLEPSGVAER